MNILHMMMGWRIRELVLEDWQTHVKNSSEALSILGEAVAMQVPLKNIGNFGSALAQAAFRLSSEQSEKSIR